ncbi:MAG: hypothetical protein H7Y61_14065 [Rhizobiales bacterium]|nr:hypothetical protein [Rhizobacter sp.]
MLRALIAALLLANFAFFAWTQGWLDTFVSVRSTGDREPERMQRQVRPELIRILPASASAAVAAPVALACFEAGPFTDADFGAAQAAAQAQLPPGSWAAVKTEQPGTWIVYMGRYADREALKQKEDELKRRRAPYEEVREPPALAPGLSLGRFDQRAAATAALEQFTLQGIRTARVVELAAPAIRHLLRVDNADTALSTQLAVLKIEGLGKGFAACAKPGG